MLYQTTDSGEIALLADVLHSKDLQTISTHLGCLVNTYLSAFKQIISNLQSS